MPSGGVVAPLRTMAAELTRVAPRRTLPDWFQGDPAHKAGVSDHNWDDKPGWHSEQSDADSIPEIRGWDIRLPLNASFTPEQLVQHIVKRARAGKLPWLRYVIFKRRIWTKSGGWATQVYTGDNPHTEHAHVSSLAARDNDTTSAGLATLTGGSAEEDWMFCKFGDSGDAVRYLQYRLKNLGFDPGAADGDYGPATATGLARAVKAHNGSTTDGRTYGPAQMIYIDVLWTVKYGSGREGPQGPEGPAGPPGAAGPAPSVDYRQLALFLIQEARSET